MFVPILLTALSQISINSVYLRSTENAIDYHQNANVSYASQFIDLNKIENIGGYYCFFSLSNFENTNDMRVFNQIEINFNIADNVNNGTNYIYQYIITFYYQSSYDQFEYRSYDVYTGLKRNNQGYTTNLNVDSYFYLENINADDESDSVENDIQRFSLLKYNNSHHPYTSLIGDHFGLYPIENSQLCHSGLPDMDSFEFYISFSSILEGTYITEEDLTDSYQDGYDTGYSNGYNTGSNDGYAEGYTEGFNTGSDDGQKSGYAEGYKLGFDNGYDQGYLSGYTDGNSNGLSQSYDDVIRQWEQRYQADLEEAWNDGYNYASENLYWDYYDEGYQVGHDDGYADGYSDAVAEDEHRYEDYQQGYDDGLSEGISQRTLVPVIFQGILTVAMLPVNIFLKVLNFNLFGVNIGSFVCSLFTVAIVIYIIRSFTGGSSSD